MADYSNTNSKTILSGTSEDDYFFNFGNGSNVTILAGAGDDNVRSFARHVSIEGGEGNDTLTSYSSGDYATISGGAGDDYIFAYGKATTLKYNLGDGNDTVVGLNFDDTIYLGQNSYTTEQSGDDLIVKVGEGSIILKDGWGKNINIQTTAGIVENNFSNYESSKVIFGTDEANKIFNGASAESSTIIAGGGNDSISNFSKKNSLCGGDGNDTIFTHSSTLYTTVNGGAGDDLLRILGTNTTVVYNAGDGNDTVIGTSYGDVFYVGQNAYSTVKSGNDVKIIIGESSMLLKNAIGVNFQIKDASTAETQTLAALFDCDENFYFGKNDGSQIFNAGSNDFVNLYDVLLSDIVSADVIGNSISINFNTGSNLQVNSAENFSPTFNLVDGNWKYEYSSATWYNA